MEVGFPDGSKATFNAFVKGYTLGAAAFAARRERRAEEMDAAAWAAARYVAVGLLAPKRFPRRPELSRPAEMDGAAMKAVFEGMVERGDAGGQGEEGAAE